MTKEQTSKFLALIKLHFQNFQTGLESVEAWFAMLKNYPADKCWLAYQSWMTAAREFPPNPSQIIAEIKKTDAPSNAALAWSNPRSDKISEKAFQLWGGQARWAMLPDPRYSDDQIEAQRTLSFARREFVDIYNGLLESRVANPTYDQLIGSGQAKDLIGAVSLQIGQKSPPRAA